MVSKLFDAGHYFAFCARRDTPRSVCCICLGRMKRIIKGNQYIYRYQNVMLVERSTNMALISISSLSGEANISLKMPLSNRKYKSTKSWNIWKQYLLFVKTPICCVEIVIAACPWRHHVIRPLIDISKISELRENGGGNTIETASSSEWNCNLEESSLITRNMSCNARWCRVTGVANCGILWRLFKICA